jgi:zinc transporter ZupT
VSKQWFQIVAIWLGVAVVGIVSVLNLKSPEIYTVFAALAGASIALVSIEHLVSAKAKDTVRQQVYVAAGSFGILSMLTLWVLLG